MQNLWHLCVCVCTLVGYSFFACVCCYCSILFHFVSVYIRICGGGLCMATVVQCTDLCFGLMDNPLVISQWNICMNRCGFFVCWSLLLLGFFFLPPSLRRPLSESSFCWFLAVLFVWCWRHFYCLNIGNVISSSTHIPTRNTYDKGMQNTCWIPI